jgi:hypothetical protein
MVAEKIPETPLAEVGDGTRPTGGHFHNVTLDAGPPSVASSGHHPDRHAER